ncbi:MFS transporter [Neoasaia chiangmaiensis]|nr:MFS transporter [Neoasaia chiangmaiensis]
MAQLDATIVNVSLTTLAHELRTSLNTIQWTMSGYLLALALTLPLSGWLVDRFGTRAVYLACFVAFTLSSALCGLAWSGESLIVFRILQGMSGGLLTPMAQLVVARVAGERLPQLAGIMTMPVLLAPLFGPAIAGVLLHVASWRWLFWLNLPVGGLAVVMAMLFLREESDRQAPRSLDLRGLGLVSVASVLFLLGLDHVAAMGGLAALLAAMTSAVSYWLWARRQGERALIDLRLLKVPPFRIALGGLFLMNGVSFAGQMLVPVYFIRDCGMSPERAGLFMMPLALGMMCVFPLMGRLTAYFGIRRLASFGAIAALSGTLLLVVMARNGFSFWMSSVGLLLRGAGIGAVGIPAMSAGYRSIAKPDLPMATTASNIVQRLGGPVITTLCAILLGWQLGTQKSTTDALTAAFAFLCAFHLLLFFVAMRLPATLPKEEN